jgi:hypothetical protein
MTTPIDSGVREMVPKTMYVYLSASVLPCNPDVPLTFTPEWESMSETREGVEAYITEWSAEDVGIITELTIESKEIARIPPDAMFRGEPEYVDWWRNRFKKPEYMPLFEGASE